MISAILLVQLLVPAVVVILKSADCTPVPKQNVSPGAGFIPVFIRVGDTPLENINPELAEAFEVYAIKNGRVGYPRPNMIANDRTKQQARTQNAVKKLEISVEETNLPHHIQKIAKTI
ncbi:unnamed protein product [Acanthoscelides obtectus]|uniref:Uncharacterized protein n=1 Tax=Acanthoscelides obtectus TaxID=200917 RepID=A0A9P0QA20_ACAOB|nr:unnamed protein product [Acanthoscelides obtectus]CAK1673565.1 hypothetical protein AOBTE_LOCUS29384 [Acanthoscelides obtectus]